MRQLIRLVEGRDAPLYHGTDLASGLMILKSNTIVATKNADYDEPQGVSLTRNFDFARGWGQDREPGGFGVVFVLDQTRLAQRYKIVPHRWTPRNGPWDRGSEAEELVLSSIKPLTSYLVSVRSDVGRLQGLLADENAFGRWFSDMYGLMGNTTEDEAQEMIRDLLRHPLLNRPYKVGSTPGGT